MPYVPLRWLADHAAVPAGATAEQVAADLVRVGLEEEAIHGPAVTGPLVVGRVLTVQAEPQKNGKTINWCQVDVGEPTGPRGIVCGAHNVGPGDHVVVALPGAVLPGPFAITARKTYGHLSDGMIASARELGLGDDHTGILVLSPEQVAGTGPGDDAVALLGLDESVVEINVTPDRGYCFSMRGVAREYAHATGVAFTDPGVLRPGERLPEPGEGFGVELDDDAPIHRKAGCDRFVARVVRGVDASVPSPAWMQRRLVQAGMRPISLAVDVTNYVMLDLGQPLHAYDLGTLAEPIVVRRARPGERLRTLDDADRALDPEDLLITDSPGGERGARALGLAGVMGGAETEVGDATTDLLIEAAHFDPVSIARTARRHRLSSEAAKRFERGVDPRLPAVAAQRVVELLLAYGGGVADDDVTDVDQTTPPAPVTMRASRPAELVGVPYTAAEVGETLTSLGCSVVEDGGTLVVTPPSWRPDLTEPADLVEEVARLRGYDQIGSVLPAAPAGRGLTTAQRRRRAVMRALAASGFVEVLSYPFVGAVHDAFGLAADDPRRGVVVLSNPLDVAAPALRTSVLDSLVEVARRNVGRGLGDLAIVEAGLVARARAERGGPVELTPVGVRPSEAQLDAMLDVVPDQPWHLAGVLAGARELPGVWGPGRPATWADAVEAVRVAARAVRVEVVATAAALAPWHPGRCAELRVAGPDGALVGHAGELHPGVTTALDLPARAVAFEVDLDALLAAAPDEAFQASPVSVYPPAKEDVALVVDAAVPVGDVLAAVRVGAGSLAEQVRLFDVYTGDQVGPGKKSVAVSLRLRAPDRTLTAEETAAVRDAVVAAAAERVGGRLRT